jgi:hypothetical protein
MIGGGKLKIDPSNIEVINKLLTPTNIIEVSGFMEQHNTCERLLHHFLRCLHHFSLRQRHERVFLGANKNRGIFDDLKRRINEAPILAVFNLQQQSEIEIDASGYAIGVGLVAALYTPGVTWKKSSIHLVFPWGQVSSQGALT